MEIENNILAKIFKEIFACPSCETPIVIKEDEFKSYFKNSLHCPNCKDKLDLWNLFLFKLNSTLFHFGAHYSLVGCIDSYKTISLNKNEKIILDLNDVIGDGILLYVNFTPSSETASGANFPLINAQNVYPRNYF